MFWSNIITGTEYALDVVTTFSGVGNLAKFRYLSKVVSSASKLRKVVTGTAAAVEITSGTVSALFKLTGVKDTAFGALILEYLFWLELLSLSGELTNALRNGLKRAATKIIQSEEDFAKLQKELDELVESGKLSKADADEVVRHLDEVGEVDLMAGPSKIGNWGGKIAKSSQIRRLRAELNRKGFLLIREEDLINKAIAKKFKKISIKLKGAIYEFDKAEDLFRFMYNVGYSGGLEAKSKQMILRKNATELVIFHEKTHLKHFEELGENYHLAPSWEKETYVWKEIWSQKHLWTKEELSESLIYVNQYRKEAGQELIKVKI